MAEAAKVEAVAKAAEAAATAKAAEEAAAAKAAEVAAAAKAAEAAATAKAAEEAATAKAAEEAAAAKAAEEAAAAKAAEEAAAVKAAEQAVASNEAEAKINAGGAHPCCADGHNWSEYRGTRGSGRACWKCYEVRDSSDKAIWYCGSSDFLKMMVAGGCPATSGPHVLTWRNGNRGSGGCCDGCGRIEDANGRVLQLPQLLGAFGPPRY